MVGAGAPGGVSGPWATAAGTSRRDPIKAKISGDSSLGVMTIAHQIRPTGNGEPNPPRGAKFPAIQTDPSTRLGACGNTGSYGIRVSSTPSTVIFQTPFTWAGGFETTNLVLKNAIPATKSL